MTQAGILKHMVTVADATRCRMLRLLARQELTVSELCAVLQLPQSTVSRHLKTLLDDGWVQSRRDGTSRFYALAELAEDARSLWGLVESTLDGAAESRQDDLRLDSVLAARRRKSQEFFSSGAAQWDHLREELFGHSFHLQALPGLLDDRWTIGDLGCGSGLVTAALAPFVARVIAVDGSAEMLDTAARRLHTAANVELRQGELESLPIADASLDAAVLVLVLHYLPDPARVLAEVARVLLPGGRLLIVDMLPHEREDYQQQMGHVWLGFSESQITRYLSGAGLVRPRLHPLRTAPNTRGPALFTATAAAPDISEHNTAAAPVLNGKALPTAALANALA
ncbi:MAG: hypothetical protein AVDCRST_MAG77-6150 [uncultured Chloroflexi bacterium]|uniref:HTH arsR-type domain-containing protein n=1 Tax=uncultured Chloroflexota bacterium TaxID=166587 RepID=A0A6J4KJK6_9CHLR|nr:MAG: hypothetical protein AVDCRST_MAG77-6150 [uncultured Chloroflexota bacterium]